MRSFFERLLPAEPVRLGFGARVFRQVDLRKVKLVVFDLDGTLYPKFDDRAVRVFGRNINRFECACGRREFELEVEKIIAGTSRFRIGRYYDPRSFSSLALPFLGSSEKFFVSDKMWQVAALASFYEVDKASVRRAYEKTKEFMSRHAAEFGMVENKRLAELLEAISGKPAVREGNACGQAVRGGEPAFEWVDGARRVVVATNSSRVDAARILENLGVLHLVDAIHSNAGKPEKSRQLFDYIARAHGVKREEMLSIGDSWVSDVKQARKLGAFTILISQDEAQGRADVVADSLDAVVSYLSLELGGLRA